jgi:hypothetical protein
VDRLRRVLRVVLCAAALLGLVPGGEEAVEALVHVVHDGHLPHSATHDEAAEDERCRDGEHRCTPFDHHCGCCASAAALPTAAPVAAVRRVPASEVARAPQDRGPPRSGVKPSLRPPIS